MGFWGFGVLGFWDKRLFHKDILKLSDLEYGNDF